MLEGKVAVVTGATGGIGFEIARELLERGAKVIVTSRKLAKAKEAAVRLGKKATPEELDVANGKSVKSFMHRISRKHNRLDILVNNAGYPFDRKTWYKEFHNDTDKELEDVLSVDLKGTVRMSQACLPLMMKRGGVIISISSTPAIAGHTEGAPYTLAKASIIAMTKHIALEYGKFNIRAYVLALGNIATEATYNSMTASERKLAAGENSMKRWGSPNEVGKVAASLAGDDFTFATGNTIVLDGGAVLH